MPKLSETRPSDVFRGIAIAVMVFFLFFVAPFMKQPASLRAEECTSVEATAAIQKERAPRERGP